MDRFDKHKEFFDCRYPDAVYVAWRGSPGCEWRVGRNAAWIQVTTDWVFVHTPPVEDEAAERHEYVVVQLPLSQCLIRWVGK